MGDRLVPTLICVLFIVVACALMWWGWQARQGRQKGLGHLQEVPSAYENLAPLVAVSGTYVGTTVHGDWLDRVSVDSLGFKSACTLFIFEDALIFSRTGAQNVFIPREDIVAVGTTSGMNGKFVEKDGLLQLSWKLNGAEVDSAMRTQYTHDQQIVLDSLRDFVVT